MCMYMYPRVKVIDLDDPLMHWLRPDDLDVKFLFFPSYLCMSSLILSMTALESITWVNLK